MWCDKFDSTSWQRRRWNVNVYVHKWRIKIEFINRIKINSQGLWRFVSNTYTTCSLPVFWLWSIAAKAVRTSIEDWLKYTQVYYILQHNITCRNTSWSSTCLSSCWSSLFHLWNFLFIYLSSLSLYTCMCETSHHLEVIPPVVLLPMQSIFNFTHSLEEKAIKGKLGLS